MDKSHPKDARLTFFFTFFHSPFVTPWLSEERIVATRSQTLYSAAMLFIWPNHIIILFIYQVPLLFYFIWPNSHEDHQDTKQKPKAFLSPTSIADSNPWKNTMSSVLKQLGECVDEKGSNFYSCLDETCIPWSQIQPLKAQIYALQVVNYLFLDFFIHVKLQLIKTSTSLENNLQSFFIAMSRQEIQSFFLSSELPWV